MKFDFQSPLTWQERNDRFSQMLGLAAKGGSGMLLPGTLAAISEVASGLVRQFPHKKKVVYLKNVDPAVEAAVINLSREGCQLVGIELSELGDPARLAVVMDGDCLFFLGSEDDPLLGRAFDLSLAVKEVEAKRTTAIIVSHARYRFLPLPDSFPKNRVYIYSLAPDLSCLATSSRMRWPLQLADRVAVRDDWEQVAAGLGVVKSVQIDLIEKFEANLPAGAKAAFAKGTPRVGDRAVIYWDDVDGWTMMSRLANAWQKPLAPAGQNEWIETTSLHRWGGVRTMEWLRAFGFTDSMIRGTLILSCEILNQKLNDDLTRIHAAVTAIQQG